MTKIKDINDSYLIKKKNIWLAASINKNEDEFCLKTQIQIKKKIKDILTIIAPRHTKRSNKIYHLTEKLKLKAQILNKGDKINKESEIIIINYFGALQNYYKYSKSVFIGKSLNKRIEVGVLPVPPIYIFPTQIIFKFIFLEFLIFFFNKIKKV